MQNIDNVIRITCENDEILVPREYLRMGRENPDIDTFDVERLTFSMVQKVLTDVETSLTKRVMAHLFLDTKDCWKHVLSLLDSEIPITNFAIIAELKAITQRLANKYRKVGRFINIDDPEFATLKKCFAWLMGRCGIEKEQPSPMVLNFGYNTLKWEVYDFIDNLPAHVTSVTLVKSAFAIPPIQRIKTLNVCTEIGPGWCVEELFLNYPRIRILDNFDKLALKRLSVGSIQKFETRFWLCPNLEHLELNFEKTPHRDDYFETFSCIQNLKSLVLRFNNDTNIDLHLERLTSLKHLELCGYKGRYEPSKTLEVLRLKKSKYPANFEDLEKLRVLLDANRYTKATAPMYDLKNMTSLEFVMIDLRKHHHRFEGLTSNTVYVSKFMHGL